MAKTKEENLDRAKTLMLEFRKDAEPLEKPGVLWLIHDAVTKARFCECHIKGSSLVKLGTTDVPIDPDGQGEYRANRNVLWENPAYKKMVEDAKKSRPFSNIVAEWTTDF